MKQNYLFTGGLLAMALTTVPSAGFATEAKGGVEVGHLRTMQLKDPVGIDNAMPSFSWILNSDARGVSQKSYRVVIATDKGLGNVVWDSGTVNSSESVNVKPEGFTPQAGTRYYWGVTVTDNKGNSAVSESPAYFETGLMGTGWDEAKWIKAGSIANTLTQPGDSGKPDLSAVKDYVVEADFEIERVAAGIIWGATDHDNYYMWQFNIEKSPTKFRPHRWSGGGAACLAEIDIPLEKERTYHMRVEVSDNGTIAKTYLDGELIDVRTGDFPCGDMGMRAAQGEVEPRPYERSFYDNFVITGNDDTTLFHEDFNNPGAIPFSAGDPIDGRLRVGGDGEVYAWQIDISMINPDLHYVVEADMTLLNDNASIIFGRTGSVNYNMWSINTVNHPNPCIRRHVYAGSQTPTWSDNEFTLFPKSELLGKERHLKIEVQGNLITTSIDGTVVDEYKDFSGSLSEGYVGFRANTGSNEDERAYWDNIKVTTYDKEGNAKVVMDEDFEGAVNQFDDAELITVNGDTKLNMYSRNGDTKVIENRASGTPIFRKAFNLGADVASAKLYTTALGNYNITINGERVGHLQADGTTVYDELMPGWTDYRKKVFYCTHDVTHLLQKGENVIGAQLSNGWWGGDIAHGVYGSPDLAFMGKLVVTLTDGTELTVGTDETWETSTDGPVKRGDIYHGETYDARDADGWDAPGYTAEGWLKAQADNQFKGDISAFEGPAVRIREHLERAPQTITIYDGVNETGTAYGQINVISTTGNRAVTLKKGETAIFDFGQNFAGWVDFTVKGNRGTQMKMRFAEMLNDAGDTNRGDDGPGGSLYTINLRNAKCILKYTLAGSPWGEQFHPSTTFFGFRYCEVTATEDVEISSIRGQVVGSETEEGSSLRVNHDAVNQLYSNILWGQRSNFLSVPTDCPQRDERLGWTADTQIFSNAAAYNANVQRFYEKWMGDMRDSQREDGAYPDVAPYCWVGYGQAVWGDAGVILPWNVYMMYGDTSIIEDNYESMERYMDYVARQSGDGWQYNGSGADSYGDWVSFEYTDRRYISVAYYAYMADLMSRMSAALSKEAGDAMAVKAQGYRQLFDNIKEEFGRRYISGGHVTENTQCGLLLALRFNLLPDDAAVATARRMLREKIESNGNKLSTGFAGTGIINQTLSEQGLNDLAYTLLLQRECPSWLYSVDQGATTIWERWDSYTKERGFHKDVTMNSFNHYAYGAVGEWMFRHMAGIAPDESNPGFGHIILAPTPDDRDDLHGQDRISDVSATFASPYGEIKSAWKRKDNGEVTYRVNVPANATATVAYPLAKGQTEVFEGGVKAADAEGVEYIGTSDGKAYFKIGSGEYIFSADGDTGVEEVRSDSKLRLYPNPATDKVHIVNGENVKEACIYDLAGACHRIAVEDNAFDVSKLAPGFYTVTVEAGHSKLTGRLIKR